MTGRYAISHNSWALIEDWSYPPLSWRRQLRGHPSASSTSAV